jgi:hypothetical protein
MDPERNETYSETRELMTSGRRTASSRIAWALAGGLGWVVMGCGEGTTPSNPEPKPAAKPAPGAESPTTAKGKKIQQDDRGIKELRETRQKKADQP